MSLDTVPAVRPLSARSVALSLLLGAGTAGLSSRDLVALGDRFGVSPPTMRVALSRLAAAGDVRALDGTYRLTERHRWRQERQEESLHPRIRPYDGSWRMIVVVSGGRSAAERGELRRELSAGRFAELREGVWMRPDTLVDPLTRADPSLVEMTTTPAHDRDLVARMWPLHQWAARGRWLLERTETPDLAERLAVHAAIVRHLRDDPWLPASLLPPDWPGDSLRIADARFRDTLSALRPSPAEENR